MANPTNQNNPNSSLLVFKSMRLEDIGKDPLSAVQNFASLYNQFGLSVYNLLSGNVQFDQNILSQIATISFATPSSYSDGANTNFTNSAFKVSFQPTGVIKLGIQQINNTTIFNKPVDFSWVYNSNGQVVIQYVTGLQPSSNYNMTFLVI